MERVCGDEIRTWNPDVIIPMPMYKRKKETKGIQSGGNTGKMSCKKAAEPG